MSETRTTGGLARLRKAALALHHDERGMETLHIVMLMGICAIILLVMWQFFPNIRKWVDYLFDSVTRKEPLPLN